MQDQRFNMYSEAYCNFLVASNKRHSGTTVSTGSSAAAGAAVNTVASSVEFYALIDITRAVM